MLSTEPIQLRIIAPFYCSIILIFVMFSEQIELRGHIIDSLILPKVLDEILGRGGNFRILEIRIGQERTDPSFARIEVSGPSPEIMDDLVRRLRLHGAEVVCEADVSCSGPRRRRVSGGLLRHDQPAD